MRWLRHAPLATLTLALLASACASGARTGSGGSADAARAPEVDAARAPEKDAEQSTRADGAPATRDAASMVDADLRDSEAGSPPVCDPASAHQRADEAMNAYVLGFWTGDMQYLRANKPADTQVPGYWIYAQGFDTVLDAVERTGGRHYAGLVRSFYLGQEMRGWNVPYYDDENWMSLALIRAYDLTGEKIYLDRAVALYRDIMAAWDTTCCGANPGGIWWDGSHTQKATAANGGPVITGARLSARTGNSEFLTFARQAYEHWYSTMVNPMTGQVSDNITTAGEIRRWKFTYNEGVMIGAALELYAATKDSTFLEQAHAFAHFMITSETKQTPLGPVLNDGTELSCKGDCQEFKGIGYRYLAALYRVDRTREEYWAVLAASAEGVWSLAHNAALGIFSTDWGGPATDMGTLAQQNSAVMTLQRYAELCGSYPASPTTGYEAEDAVLRQVGVEAKYPRFSGWAYVPLGNHDGKAIEFRIQVDTAGKYRATLDYSAGAGAAARVLALDGAVVASSLLFPATGGWEQWAREAVEVMLPAGATSLTLSFESARGSTNFLNVDRLTLSPL